MTALETNLSALKNNQRNLNAINAVRAAASGANSAAPAADAFSARLSNGTVFVSYGKRPLVSQYDPQKEARVRIDACCANRTVITHAVFSGMGGLHPVDAFLAAYPQCRNIIIAEQSAELAVAVLSAAVFPWLDRAVFLIGETVARCIDHCDTHIPDYCADTTVLIPNQRARFYDEAYFRALDSALAGFLERKFMSMTTFYYFAPRWMANIGYNLKRNRGASFSAYRGILNGAMPLIVVGGGPSIDRSIDELTSLAPGAFLLATATSSATLLHAGIRPDAVISTDGGFYATSHLTACYESGIPLISTHTAYGPPLAHNAPVYYFSHGMHAERLCYPETPEYPMEGSVLSSAVRAGASLHPSCIILAAADFCFHDEKTHSAASASHRIDYASSQKLAPLAARNFRRQGDRITAADYNGKSVTTSATLEAYRCQMEMLVADLAVPVFTMSSASARIAGVTPRNRSPLPPVKKPSPAHIPEIIAPQRLVDECRRIADAVRKRDAETLAGSELAWESVPFYMKRYLANRTEENAERLCSELYGVMASLGAA